jgi:DNA polymerase III epsilon subunit-like protein
MTHSVVALDVNPGGDFWAEGHFGVAEVVADEITANFEINYRHPRDGEAEEFRAAWTWLESFIGDRPVVAYNAQYDLNAIARMLVRAEVAPPAMSFVCVYEMRQQLLPAGNLRLWGTVFRLGLESQEEMAPLFPVNTGAVIPSMHDARACARLLVHLASRKGVTPGELVESWRSRSLASARAFSGN